LGKKRSTALFNSIAPVYGLFYKIQKKRFAEVIKGIAGVLDLTDFETVIDIGCGTGALCSVLSEKGLTVTGIDSAQNMLKVARAKSENNKISFIQADVLEPLPFIDKSFDVAIASFVAHGLKVEARGLMYAEMSRIAKHYVIIYDYNERRSPLVTLIEWLEGGDYVRFVSNAGPEMKSCFADVKVVAIDTRVAWYICTPVS